MKKICLKIAIIFTLGMLIGYAVLFLGGQETMAKDADGNVVVVLDPGHGGHDGGAVSVHGYNESTLNWNIAMALKAELETYQGVKVYLTKGSAEWFSNSGRGLAGVNYNADVFISCHNNSNTSSDPHGVTVYSTVAPAHKDAMARLSDMILDEVSACGLARMGYSQVSFSGDQPDRNYYTMLDESNKVNIPGLIIEHAFLSNENDASFIENKDNQNRVGAADARAIAKYYGLSKRTVKAGTDLTLTRTYSASVAADGASGYKSTNEQVAYVSQEGLITAVGAGSATISFKDSNGNKQSVNVYVPDVTLVALSAGLNPSFFDSEGSILGFKKDQVMVKAIYSDGSVRQLADGYKIGNPSSQGNGLYFIPVTYKGLSTNLRLYIDTYLCNVGNYAWNDFEVVGSNEDILRIPGSFDTHSGNTAVVEPSSYEEPKTEEPKTEEPQPEEPKPEEPQPEEPQPVEPQPENTQPQQEQTEAFVEPESQTETTKTETSEETESATAQTETATSIESESAQETQTAETSKEGNSKPQTGFLVILIGVISAAIIAMIIVIAVRNKQTR